VDSELSVDDTMKLMIGYGGGVAQDGPTSCTILPIPMCSNELCLMLAWDRRYLSPVPSSLLCMKT